MTEQADIIILSSSRWDDPYSSSAYSLAKEFSRNNRVFFLDHPFTFKDFLSRYRVDSTIKSRKKALLFGKDYFKKIDGLSENFISVTPKLTLPVNWLKPGSVYQFASRINDKILAGTIRKLKKQFGIKDYIFINIFDPFYFRSFPQDLKPRINIYYTVDDISQEAYISRHGIYLEKEAATNADISLATSRELYKSLPVPPGKKFFLPNAADTFLFNRAMYDELPVPAELRNVEKKVILYTGNIGLRIDYPLLRMIAKAHSEKILLMVGPAGSESLKELSPEEFPNVVFAGAKKIEELPSYLQHSHCAIIPFEINKLTKSIYPLKINEYLAAGKPVVATAFSEDILEFQDVSYIARSEAEFVQMIDIAIDEDDASKQKLRCERAATNTWTARVDQFWQIIKSNADPEQVK